jgi:hypothetical protein
MKEVQVHCSNQDSNKGKKLNSVALVREQIIPTKQPQLVAEVSVNSCG